MTTQSLPTEATASHGQRTKKPTFFKALLFLIVLALIGFGIAAFVVTQRSEAGPLVAVNEPEPLVVKVVEVELSETLTLSDKFTGMATPRRTSMLGFQTGGRIESVRVDTGSEVKKGQTLARLDTRSLQAQLAAANAAVDEARAGRDIAQTTVTRQQTLLEKGHVSQQRVDEAQAQVDAANARILAAQAQADTLKVQIDLARITAPFGGVITKRLADEGSIAAPGVPLLELVETGNMEARIGLPADEAASLVVGETYSLATGDRLVEAKLRAMTGVIDAGARTVTTVFDIQNADLPAGSVVRLALDRAVAERGVWVPIGALTEGNRGLWAVYVAEPDGGKWRARKRPVEIVQAEADRAFVRGALSSGDKVIQEGIRRLSPGMPVTPSEAELARSLQE